MTAITHFIEYSPWAPVIPVLLIVALIINFINVCRDEIRRHRDRR